MVIKRRVAITKWLNTPARTTTDFFQKTEFPDLRYITNTGGPMPQNVLRMLRDRLAGTQVFLMYGLTEAFRSTYLPPYQVDRRPTSIGKAIPNAEILVVREGDGTKVLHYGQMWRMQLYFWDSGYRAFTANMGVPGKIVSSIQDTIGE